MRQAVIDIGSNTVKLLVGEVADGAVTALLARDLTTRLGHNVQQTRQLAPAAIARTLAAIDGFAAAARELGAERLVAVTTSAARDADNCAEFLAAVRAQCGLAVEVISGEREAELIFRGVASDPRWGGQTLTVVDVGGGSAEAIQGRGSKITRRASRPLGALRLAEQFDADQFPALCEHLRTTWRAVLHDYTRGLPVVGTGGCLTTLARIAKGAAEHAVFAELELRTLALGLNAMPLAARRAVPGMPADRADIIVPGAMVYILALEALGAAQLTVSVRNLRHGVLLEDAAHEP